MISIPTGKISPETLAAAHQLHSYEGSLPSVQDEYGYFTAIRDEKQTGSTDIKLTQGSYGDAGGYECFASQIVLSFGKIGQFEKISYREGYEPSSPISHIPHPVIDPIEALYKIKCLVSVKERAISRQYAKDKAARYIAKAFALIDVT